MADAPTIPLPVTESAAGVAADPVIAALSVVTVGDPAFVDVWGDDDAAAAAAVPAPAATTAGTDEDVGKEEEEEAADGDTTFCW